MAEAFLQIVVDTLSVLIKEEVGLIMGMDGEMKKLSSSLTTIQAVLEDAEEKQLQSKPIRDWLRKLNDLTYEIDDLLDECALHASKLKHRNNKFSPDGLKKLLYRHKLGRRIKQVAENLEDVAAEHEKFHLREFAAIQMPIQVGATRETGSLLSEPDHVFGRDDDREKIVDILLNQIQGNKETSVLPIIGVGGLGKTTLAQLVFNDQRVVNHFKKRLWVCVSDNFDVKSLVKAMIESATKSGSDSDLQHLDSLQSRLQELLNQERYLLVLDDVWNEHQEKWFQLRNILACGSAGASIIVTTRLKMVADIMGTLPTYYLAGLPEEDCWKLLRQRAFGEEIEVSPDLEAIGKQIVKKCAGVPLAAKALGGVLRFKRREEEWIQVRDSEIWKLSLDEALIVPALRLSYHHLPLSLRQCFAYWAVFPKDHTLEKKELIFLWMAHGYISSKDMLEVEDVGYEICNELVLRSLLQVDGSGNLHMHDLVHDLAELIMESKIPGHRLEENVTSFARIRQVDLRKKLVAFPKSIQLDMDMTYILKKFTRLRVLDANDTSIEELSSKVSNLQHLRCLHLSDTNIRTLPNSLCSLWHLKILNLDWCGDLVALPKNLRSLRNLRHLLLRGCDSLREMPQKIGEMSSLKTLGLFIVGVSRGNKLEELELLDLGGDLEIKHLERVENHMDAKKANLAGKKNLQELKLVWERKSGASRLRNEIDEEVLEGLQPHPSLETLRIEGFSGGCLPVWMTTLHKIFRIEIADCPNAVRLPELGELPHLRCLKLKNVGIAYMDDEVEVNSTRFPSLESLYLTSLPNLRGLLKEQVIRTSALAAFPKLETLWIESCCSSLILPPFSSLKELRAVNCSGATLASFSEMDSLTRLYVSIDDEQMKCFAVEMLEKLTSLVSLTISTPQELPVLEQGLRGLKSLALLKIRGSPKVRRIPQGWFPHLTALNSLFIFRCEELVELPDEMRYLHNLHGLYLHRLPKMVALPKAIQHISSLQELEISYLPQLNSLPDWIHHLTSLQSLNVSDCPMLARLPTCIKGMTSLQALEINGCSEVERRCERGKGEDWHLIAHIQHLNIGGGASSYRVG